MRITQKRGLAASGGIDRLLFRKSLPRSGHIGSLCGTIFRRNWVHTFMDMACYLS
jgi:hypothetical protein